ncbi:MAG: hypothetical protein JXM79_02580 [Sedimentisphaerales bacterium]|nr:hypothetical protein [Sedimentisphaerales bacterium]
MESRGSDKTMVRRKKTIRKAEFGDFQTPIELARKVCSILYQLGLEPASVLEPTCGKGSFIEAALEFFPCVRNIFGIDINSEYIQVARSFLQKHTYTDGSININIIDKDFFSMDWDSVLRRLPDPLLLIGNPPWVTNTELGRIGSCNLPDKSNFQNLRGIDAITGNSNFDISEWMLHQALEWINDRQATLAMLCKTTVARKVLYDAWKNEQQLKTIKIYQIDTFRYFEAAVDACLLVVSTGQSNEHTDCLVYDNLNHSIPTTTFGYREGRLVANIACYERWKHLGGKERYKWRSGIKHDCTKVMELKKELEGYKNGYGELVDLESDFLYPLFKSSDIANGSNQQPKRWMLVPQRIVGENTNQIRRLAPKTWQYLHKHAQALDKRASSVYRNRPRFSIFGVGDYSFSKWKVAISGFYKKLEFKVVGPYGEKPIVLDDTCYFVACKTKEEALFIADLLNSDIAKDFFSAFIFWDEKRPITVGLLKKLDLLALARKLNTEETLEEFLNQYPGSHDQPLLFSERPFNS